MKQKRTIVQLISTLAHNAWVPGFFSNSIFQGNTKGICVPGLNCYSCPGAIGACPVGSLQASFAGGFKPLMYVVGILMFFGSLFGRFVCGWLCPFGFVQELLYKIKTKKIPSHKIPRFLRLIKYVVLAVFVIFLPLLYLYSKGLATPAFCKYLCPAGTLEGGVFLALFDEGLRSTMGWLFSWKFFLLIVVLAMSIFENRFFCKFLCPLGAIYSFFNPIAIFGIKVDSEKCTHCHACVKNCKMQAKKINDAECIRCGECADTCHFGAIYTTNIFRSKK